MAGRNDVCGLVGTSFTAKRWLSLDICGFLGITLSWGVHAYALYVLGAYTIENSLASTVVFFSLYIPIALLALSSLYMAWTTDPGAVPLGARPLTIVRRANSGALSTARSQARGTRRCPKCHDNYKPPRAHHDSVTGRCVVKFDHFCPWVRTRVWQRSVSMLMRAGMRMCVGTHVDKVDFPPSSHKIRSATYHSCKFL
jgi:palmitoyltransferase